MSTVDLGCMVCGHSPEEIQRLRAELAQARELVTAWHRKEAQARGFHTDAFRKLDQAKRTMEEVATGLLECIAYAERDIEIDGEWQVDPDAMLEWMQRMAEKLGGDQ